MTDAAPNPNQETVPPAQPPNSNQGTVRLAHPPNATIQENEARGTVPTPPTSPSHPGWEILLVLGLSLGQSAVYSLLSYIRELTANVPMNQQTTSMNSSVTPDRPWLDLTYQITNIVFPAIPALLALYFLRLSGDRKKIGFDLARPGRDIGWGAIMAACIGIPGLALYVAAQHFGFNTTVAPANLASNWWTVPVLICLAAMNGFLEEIVMIGFFFVKAQALRWEPWMIVVVSATIRGAYHAYQGGGGLAGNFVMGLVFGLFYLRTKRVAPLVVAHTFLDIVSFVGYALLSPYLSWLP